MSLLRFQPIYQERVWGGRTLAGRLGRTLPADRPIGESWEVVDRPEANSRVRGGPHDGKTLRELLTSSAEAILGPGADPSAPFPILVKWLDCAQRLSLQVHPPAAVAAKLGGEPKTENWYIAATEGDAALIAGLRVGVTREQFEQALEANELEPLLHRVPSSVGDSLFVPSGRIHAIDAGNLILEIQQNSDTTYRVYDWGRVGLDGNPRDLHVAESLESIDFEDFEPPLVRSGPVGSETLLADAPEFRLRRFALRAGRDLRFPARTDTSLLHVVGGAVADGDGTVLGAGENVLLPWADEFTFRTQRESVVLITDRFRGDR